MELISFAVARVGGRRKGEWNVSFQIGWNVYQLFFVIVVALFVVMNLCSSFFTEKKRLAEFFPCKHATFRNLQFHQYYFSVSFSFHFCFAWLLCSRFFLCWFARAFILTLACVHNRKIVISPSLSIKLIIKHSSCSRQCERIHAQAHTHRFRWHPTAISHIHCNHDCNTTHSFTSQLAFRLGVILINHYR